MSDTQIILGQRIRHYRKMRNLTQKELAAEIGVAPKYISCIEQGIKGPSLDKLVEICKWFGISLADILPIEKHDNREVKEVWISEIADACRVMETAQVGLLKTMVCSIKG